MSLEVKLEETKELLKTVRHAAMATVNPDGSPHNTPLFIMYNSDFSKLYWGSNLNAQHSKNVTHSGNIFVTFFDSFTQGNGGLYVTANNAHETSANELREALDIHNTFRAKYGKDPLTLAYYTENEQRMYAADVEKLEVYSVERDQEGHIKQEVRTLIKSEQLMGKNWGEL